MISCAYTPNRFARNAGSRRVLEKAGFTIEGVMRRGVCKRGEVLDYCMYALVPDDTVDGCMQSVCENI